MNNGGGLVAKSCPTLATPWTVARQAGRSMGLSRQGHWSGPPLPFLGDLPPQGRIRVSYSPALAGGFFTASATREARCVPRAPLNTTREETTRNLRRLIHRWTRSYVTDSSTPKTSRPFDSPRKPTVTSIPLLK